jgi:hypothetical protein
MPLTCPDGRPSRGETSPSREEGGRGPGGRHACPGAWPSAGQSAVSPTPDGEGCPKCRSENFGHDRRMIQDWQTLHIQLSVVRRAASRLGGSERQGSGGHGSSCLCLRYGETLPRRLSSARSGKKVRVWAGQGRAGQDRTGQDRTGQGRAGLEQTGPDRTMLGQGSDGGSPCGWNRVRIFAKPVEKKRRREARVRRGGGGGGFRRPDVWGKASVDGSRSLIWWVRSPMMTAVDIAMRGGRSFRRVSGFPSGRG